MNMLCFRTAVRDFPVETGVVFGVHYQGGVDWWCLMGPQGQKRRGDWPGQEKVQGERESNWTGRADVELSKKTAHIADGKLRHHAQMKHRICTQNAVLQ
ncbi:hypothetical protein MHYP_G00041250 [Metynnis hypsauchen]